MPNKWHGLCQDVIMPDENLRSSFPSTQRDISKLTQTATDAASDLVSSATEHASKVKGQLKDLAGHAQEEGAERLDQAKGQLCGVLSAAKDYASERPLVCVGVALAVGFLLGLTRRTTPHS